MEKKNTPSERSSLAQICGQVKCWFAEQSIFDEVTQLHRPCVQY